MASDSFADFQRQFELFFNQDRAELAAVRAILQSLLLSLTANAPAQRAEMFDVVKRLALAQFEMPPPSEASDQGLTRMRELSRSEVEAFFAQFDLPPSETGPKPDAAH